MLSAFPKARTDKNDAEGLVCRINNAARAELVLRAHRERWPTYPAILSAVWDHDWLELIKVAGSGGAPNVVELFQAARYDVSHIPEKIVVYRGGVCHADCNPGDVAQGASWTRSLPVAAWFATTFYNSQARLKSPGTSPVVLRAVIDRKHVLATVNSRREREVVAHPWMTYQSATIQGYRDWSVFEFVGNFQAPAELIARWRKAAARHKS